MRCWRTLASLLFVLCLASKARAQTLVNFTGWESQSTAAGFEGCQSSSGTHSISTAVFASGLASLRTNPATSGTGYYRCAELSAAGANQNFSGSLVNEIYVSFKFRVDTLPAANNEPFFVADNTFGPVFSLRISSAGVISLYGGGAGNTLIATGATSLSTATWYRIDARITNGNPGAYEVLIDGVSELSGTDDFHTQNYIQLIFGKYENKNSQSVDFYYDDAGWSASGYPENINVVRAAPISSPVNAWTGGTGSSDWQEVDEVPPSTAEYAAATAAGGAFYNTVESTAALGVTGQIRAVKGYAHVLGSSAITHVRINSGGSNVSTGSVSNFGTVSRNLVATVDPNTSSAWTYSGFDALTVGQLDGSTDAVARSYWTGVMLATDETDPVATPTPTPTATFTVTPTPTVTNTPTPTFTPTDTPTPTLTPTNTATPTPTPTFTNTPTPTPTSAAVSVRFRNFTGFESGSNSGESQIQSQGSADWAYAVDPRTGSYSYRSSPTVFNRSSACFGEINASTGAGQGFTGDAQDRIYVSTYFSLLDPPPVDNWYVLGVTSYGPFTAMPICVKVGPDRILRVYNGSICQNLVATGSTTLTLSDWYLLEGSFRQGVSAFEVKLNGVVEMSGVVDQGSEGFQCINIGCAPYDTCQPYDMKYDDLGISSDGYPGSFRVKNAYPTADSTPADWTFGTPPSDWSTINDPDPDSVNNTGIQCDSSAGDKQDYVDVANAADLSITGTILALKPYMKSERTGGVATTETVLSLRSGAALSQNSPIDVLTTKYRWRICEADPATGVPWTLSGFDSATVGVIEKAASETTTFWLGSMVAYVDPTPTPIKRDNLPVLGVG